MKYFIPTATAFILCLLACNTKDTKPGEAIKPDFVFENLDTTMNPGTDFFQYANGGWIKKNPIPADQSSWGIGNLVIEENIKRLREISESAALAPNSIKGSADQMIGDFWTAGMDSAKIEHDGLKYLQPYLTLIEEAKDLPALINVVTELKKIGSGAFFC